MKMKVESCKPHVAFMSCIPDDERSLESNLRQTGLKFVKGLGCYQGVQENSYMIVLSTEMHVATSKLNQVMRLGRMYGQESILYCDPDRTSYLMYCDESSAPKLGTLKAVGLIPDGDDWSFFGGSYWQIK